MSNCPHGFSSPAWCDKCQSMPLRRQVLEGTPNYDEANVATIVYRGRDYKPVRNSTTGTHYCYGCKEGIIPGQRFIKVGGRKYHIRCAMETLPAAEAIHGGSKDQNNQGSGLGSSSQ